MWGESELEHDLQNLKKGEYSDLYVLQMEHPADQTLLYRFNMVTLMAYFKQNNFSELTRHSNAYLESIQTYLKTWSIENIDPGVPAPPFDFILLVCMTATKGNDSYDKLIRVFRYYVNIRNELEKLNSERSIRLTDMTKTTDMMMTVDKAKIIITKRINYLAENVVSLLHTNDCQDVLISFLLDFAPPSFFKDDATLSCLGRAALANGERELANKYFSLVQSTNYKSANSGYIAFFDSQFTTAFTAFNRKTEGCPTDASAVRLHMGEFKSDLLEPPSKSKKVMPESLSRWPALPRNTEYLFDSSENIAHMGD